MRSPIYVTVAVWRAIFLRESIDRLFDMRAAWFWLLAEPILHIGFMTFILTVIRVRTVGNVDVVIWVVIGMLAFFLFRRTAVQVTYAVDSNKPFFTYRQVKPFDPAIARALLEALLMTIVSIIILLSAVLLDHAILPDDAILVVFSVFGLWLFGFGYGLIASVLMELVPEMEHILKILMIPIYLISGVIWPLTSVPQPYLEMLMFNPVAHGIELVRLGFFAYYHAAPDSSIVYLYTWAIASVFIGLLLFRRFSLRLIMR